MWKRSYALALQVYRLTSAFPSSERYGLTNQMRRASVSVPSNIAEGFLRRSKVEKVRFLNIAQGSLGELKCQLMLSRDLDLSDTSPAIKDADEIGRLLHGYMTKILPQAQAEASSRAKVVEEESSPYGLTIDDQFFEVDQQSEHLETDS